MYLKLRKTASVAAGLGVTDWITIQSVPPRVNFNTAVIYLHKELDATQNLPDLVGYLNSSKNILNPNHFDDDLLQVQQNGVIRFNAGFTKIYSLCINNFPMYDSRVAIALGILISEFLRFQQLSIIPDELRFRMPPGGTVTTRPSTINCFRFGATNLTTYQISNIRASWLLEAVLQYRPESQFNQLEPNEKIRALEAALFMIGYSI